MTDWVPYMNGLPNVVVNELEINYNTQKIVAATFGRGIWESDLNTNSVNTSNVTLNDIKIYPNPASDHITIQGIFDKKCTINIYSMTGQKVYSTTSRKISTKELKSGCYSIEIKGENIYPVVKKLIIE